MFKDNNSKRAFTLVEFLLVLAAFGVVISGVYGLYSQATSTTTIQQEKQNIISMASTIESLYSGENNYNGLSTSLMFNTESFPQNLRLNGPGNVVHSWDNNVNITTAGGGSRYEIEYQNVPQGVCVKISQTQGDWNAVLINGTTVDNANDVVNVASVSGPCSGGDNVAFQSL
jgi:prepilin-type N-terminal cleavage/methylation domain-containing protein